MSNPTPPDSEYHVVSPADHAGLTCRFLKPSDFAIADIPNETPDFSESAVFMPLAIAVTQYGPMVFTVAARPPFSDGTVADWLDYICRKEGYPHDPITRTRIGNLPAVTCDATQQAEGMTMKMRFVLLEDGGRLFQISAMAPEPFWDGAVRKMAPMFESFELREARGTQIALMPGDPAPAPSPNPPAAGAPEPAAPQPAVATPQPPAAPEVAPAQTTPPEVPDSQRVLLNAKELAALALANDASSLDPEHPMNANLRNNGVGFTAKVASVDLAAKAACVGTGSLQGFFRIPLGWHAIDDGKRTLVFDAEGKMQVNLSQRVHEGLSTTEFARACLNPHLEAQPDLPLAEMEMQGIAGAFVRGANIGGEILDQCFLVRDLGRPGLYLVARVTGTGADTTRAMDMAGDILATFAEAPFNPAP